jgi:hypothetical protein
LGFDDADPVGDAPFGAAGALPFLEVIDIAPGRHQVRRLHGNAGEQVIGFAVGIIALQVTKVVEDAMRGGLHRQRGAIGPRDEIVGRADEVAMILDGVAPVA